MDETLIQDLLASVRRDGRKRAPRSMFDDPADWPDPDVRAIRVGSGLSQANFARMIGVSRRTLENWEQNRARPTGPARALLRIVAANPQAAMDALARSCPD